MVTTVGRLKRSKRGKGVQVSGESCVNDAFENLGNEVEIGNGTVAGQVIGGKIVLFNDRSDYGLFERLREATTG
jgi:hypothetical protein